MFKNRFLESGATEAIGEGAEQLIENVADVAANNIARGLAEQGENAPQFRTADGEVKTIGDIFDDVAMSALGGLVSGPVGRFNANRWGLFDMHGNVAEWTRSLYRDYPYRDDDGRNQVEAEGRRVVRGGSWRDRPFRAAAGFRLAYLPFQRVVDVGFRVIVDADLAEFPARSSAAVADN